MERARNAVSIGSIWDRRGTVELAVLLGMTAILGLVAWLFPFVR
jgi:hypothetical protein